MGTAHRGVGKATRKRRSRPTDISAPSHPFSANASRRTLSITMFGRKRAGSDALAIATAATRSRLAVVTTWIGKASKNRPPERHADRQDRLTGTVFVAARRQFLRIGALQLQSPSRTKANRTSRSTNSEIRCRGARIRRIESAAVRSTILTDALCRGTRRRSQGAGASAWASWRSRLVPSHRRSARRRDPPKAPRPDLDTFERLPEHRFDRVTAKFADDADPRHCQPPPTADRRRRRDHPAASYPFEGQSGRRFPGSAQTN